MAVETTRITGLVITPAGTPATGGKMRIRLSGPGKVEDGAVTQKIGGNVEVAIGSNGAVDFVLVPNDAILPAGTVYHVQFETPSGFRWSEHWSLATAPDPIEIGDITQVNP
jgi:hypothetical protein